MFLLFPIYLPNMKHSNSFRYFSTFSIEWNSYNFFLSFSVLVTPGEEMTGCGQNHKPQTAIKRINHPFSLCPNQGKNITG